MPAVSTRIAGLVDLFRSRSEQAKRKISKLGLGHTIEMENSYLDDEHSLLELERSDLIVFPYQTTGESASAAVRHGIATGKPVAVTPLSIFENVMPAVHVLPGVTPEKIAAGIFDLALKIDLDDDEIKKKENMARRWCEQMSYPVLGRRINCFLKALDRDSSAAPPDLSSDLSHFSNRPEAS